MSGAKITINLLGVGGAPNEDDIATAVERVAGQIREGYTSGYDGGVTWDLTIKGK